ncbi:unnamed protein product [Urochloa humidicola]
MPSKGQRIPPPSLNRASTPSSQQVYRTPPATEKTAATSKAAAKGPATPPPATATVTGYPPVKNQPLFVQDNLAKETKPAGKGPTIPHGSRRS